MEGYHFCTIATPDFLSFTEALHLSFKKQSQETYLHILVVDDQKRTGKEGLVYYNLSDLTYDPATLEIIGKYQNELDFLRWALKPAFLLHVLQHQSKVFYADNDLFFFKPFAFLFEMLNESSLVLSPHWCSFNPFQHEENFMMNFQSGLFNAGFVGATQEASLFLKWWQNACLYKMSKQTEDGFFVDQRYLDIAILLNEKTRLIRHPGCNVGSWNMHQNKRTKKSGEVLINGHHPIVFIHFNEETIRHILNGNDSLLMPYLQEFKTAVANAGGDFIHQKNLTGFTATASTTSLKRSLKIRTRLKKWLYYLSQKL